MYRSIEAMVIFLDRPSKNESISPAAKSWYPRVLLQASSFQATFGLTTRGFGSNFCELLMDISESPRTVDAVGGDCQKAASL